MLRSLTRLAPLLILMCLLAACSGKSGGSGQSASGGQGGASYDDLSFYYDFEDVLIPKELTLDDEDTFVFESAQFKTGLLVFTGDLDPFSLVDFFNANMAKDNWLRHSSLKASKSVMVFEKPSKSCFITIIDQNFYSTRVEILVVETMSGGGMSSGSSSLRAPGAGGAPRTASPRGTLPAPPPASSSYSSGVGASGSGLSGKPLSE